MDEIIYPVSIYAKRIPAGNTTRSREKTKSKIASGRSPSTAVNFQGTFNMVVQV